LVRFVNFAGAKAKNYISKVNDVSPQNVHLRDAVSHPVNTVVLEAVVAGIALAESLIICGSCAPNNAPAASMVF
jgi:hypothetical protein